MGLIPWNMKDSERKVKVLKVVVKLLEAQIN